MLTEKTTYLPHQPLLPADQIYSKVNLSPNPTPITNSLNYPIAQWGFLNDRNKETLDLLEISKRGTITANLVEEIGPLLFKDSPDIIESAFSKLKKLDTADKDSLIGWWLTFGDLAQILMFRKIKDNKLGYFVTYLSKEPMDSQKAKITEQDFNDLLWLNQQYKKKLKPEFQPYFAVAEPLEKGVVNFQDRQYPFFIMNYIPLGELGVNIHFFNKVPIPYFQYVIPFNEEMKKFNLENLKNLLGNNYDGYNSQASTLLLSLCLTYLISNHRLPEELSLNSGDIIADLDHHITALTSVKGGFSQELSEDEFIERIITHPEYHDKTKTFITPFSNFKPEDIKQLLQKACSMII